MANLAFEVPARFRRGRYGDDEQREVESGVRIIQLIARSFGIADLGDVNWLALGMAANMYRRYCTETYRSGDTWVSMSIGG